MTTTDRDRLIEEAADIFLSLRDEPDNGELERRKKAFLERGTVEREVYREVERAWGVAKTAKRGRKRRTGPILALAASLVVALYLGPGLYLSIIADIRTTNLSQEITLQSGDSAHLDAETAIQEESDNSARRITLLQGAAYFDVAPDGRPFVVAADNLSIRVTGTAFEVNKAFDVILVSVFEGVVEVTDGEHTQIVQEGERVIHSTVETTSPEKVDQSSIARWRDNRIVADGMTFAQLAAVLERRIPGNVIIVGDDLQATQITGGYDLTKPLSALRSMAAVRNARVITVPSVVTVVIEN
ncbi:MAG: FecR domain-containing protein [Pseudomonadota bacterium]